MLCCTNAEQMQSVLACFENKSGISEINYTYSKVLFHTTPKLMHARGNQV